MDNDINLLPAKKSSVLHGEQLLARFRVVAILCVVVTISVGIGIFIINSINSPDALKAQATSMSASLMGSEKKAKSYIQLVDRVHNIQKILSIRSSLEDNIIVLKKQIPQAVAIQAFSLDDKSLTMSVRASNLTDIDTVIGNMTSLLHTKKFIKKMTIEDVVADQKTGTFSLSLDGTL